MKIRNYALILLVMPVSVVFSAQAAIPEGFRAPDTIPGIGRDDIRGEEAGKLIARRIIDAVKVHAAYGVDNFRLKGYNQSSPLGTLIAKATRSEIILRGSAPGPVTHLVSGIIERLGDDAVLRVSIVRKSDGLNIPVEPILLVNMGNRSEQGIVSSLKPW